MKRIIVPTGYMGSGSSAVTDLLKEFKNCENNYNDFEYVFLHCPNGVFDLEDKLLKNNNAIRSDEAIRTFYEQMNKLYNKKFWWIGNYKNIIGKEFKTYVDEYTNNLVQFNFDGFWYTHEEVNSIMFIKLLLKKPFKILGINTKKVLKYNDGMKISYISETDFYKYSKNFIYKTLEKISNFKENVILDQLILPFNIHRIDNYFDDKLKVIVVQRDPRDVYILNKYIWPQKNLVIPMPKDAKEFCEFYKNMRESEIKTETKKVLRINFEDLIYEYEPTIKKIKDFLNFNEKDHIFQKKFFNPDISIKNTQLFNDDKYKKEISYIEKELNKYLYKFPYKLENTIENTVEF